MTLEVRDDVCQHDLVELPNPDSRPAGFLKSMP
jgi:hypothetical protein